MNRLIVSLAVLLTAASGAAAQPVSFKGKTVTMVIGFAPGGGTDLSWRLIAAFFGRFLPGEPTVVTQNMPGAEGLTALNFFVQQARPDGLTLTMGSGAQADPTHYRKPQSHYDPTKFAFIGGAGRGGSALVINKAADARIRDASATPAIMGSTSGAPRTNLQRAAWGKEFLGWNLKWILGYRGTSDLFVALDRGEIDMTATSNVAPIGKLLATGRFKVFAQSGALKDGEFRPRPDFGDAPVLPKLLEGKITQPLAKKSFDYWMTVHSGPEKWLALPPGTPEPIAAAYREAFRRMAEDPEFLDRARKMADDFTLMAHGDAARWMQALADSSSDALGFIAGMLRRQGVKID
jgi:tripartite-type tricarboxylate transporter receptor subunit TctC